MAHYQIPGTIRARFSFYNTKEEIDIFANAIVSMMIHVLSGHTPDEIINALLNFIERIGFKSMLSMKCAGGLESIIKQMKLEAVVYKTIPFPYIS